MTSLLCRSLLVPALLAIVAGAGRAQDSAAPRPLFFDRIEVEGFSGRQECLVMDVLENTRVEGWGVRLERRLRPGIALGVTGGMVEREGSLTPVVPDGATGSLYYQVDDRDMAYRVGVTYHPVEHLPIPTGSARLGRADEIYFSAAFLQTTPTFSSDDLDVGLGWHAAEPIDLWIGATAPLNRDVVGGKMHLALRPFRNLELGVTGRAGKSRAGRIHGLSLSLAYVNPEPLDTEPVRRRSRSWFLPSEPGKLQYVGAGVIAGAVGGVLVSGIVTQKACGDTGVGPALGGIAVGGLLGMFFGRAMWQ